MKTKVFEGFRASGAAKDGARWLQDGYKRSQDELGRGWKVPERQDRRRDNSLGAPVERQDRPKAAQKAPRWLQGGPMEAPRKPQEGFKWGQDEAKMAQNRP